MRAVKSGTQLATASDFVQQIPVEQLFLSPEETRRTIDQAALAELAESIEKDGVIEALLVRPGVNGLSGCFEIVAGQRRWLASKIAGRPNCPCVSREMTDEEARGLRIVSNLQREDLPPMEEAEAYGKLLEEPGATVETVAAKLAKSPSYVGRRLQLLKAIKPVREALKAGAIEVGHALELARLEEGAQREMLTTMRVGATLIEPDDIEDAAAESGTCRFCGCTDEYGCDEGCGWVNGEHTVCSNPKCLEAFREQTGQEDVAWQKTFYSVAELRRKIAASSHVDLKTAPFPLIADLAPMPCADCPKRAGNAQLLFDDCAQDTCLDRACFNRKVNAWIAAELRAAEAEKRKLLKLSVSWTSEKDEIEVGGYRGVYLFKTPHECGNGEEGIWINGPDAGKRAIVCRKADCKTHRGSTRSGSSSSDSRSSAPDPKRKAFLLRVRTEKAYRGALFGAIATVPATSITVGRLHQLAGRLAVFAFGKSDSTRYGDLAAAMAINKGFFGWNGREKLKKHVAALSIHQQLLFAAMAIEDSELCVHEHDVPGGGAVNKQRKLDLEELAEIVGVDWKALRKKHETAAAKPAKDISKKLPKAAPKKAKKSPTKKVARK